MSNDKMREALEMLNAEEPEYHSQGMGCGLEDRCITDRYEAMSHGWDSAMERVYSEVINPVRDTLNDSLSQQPESEPVEGGGEVYVLNILQDAVDLLDAEDGAIEKGSPFHRRIKSMLGAVDKGTLDPEPSAQEVELDDVLAWADGIQGALGSEIAARVTDREAVIATAIERAASAQPSAQVPEAAIERMAEAGARDSLPRNGMYSPEQLDYMRGERLPAYRDLARLMLDAAGIPVAAPSIAEKREPISCAERLPTPDDADMYGDVLWLWSGVWTLGKQRDGVPVNATHWMRSDQYGPEPAGPKS